MVNDLCRRALLDDASNVFKPHELKGVLPHFYGRFEKG